MAPAGSFDSLASALRAGADSVYFGAGSLNMRHGASASFQLKDIRRIARKCRWCGVKSYLALNVTMFDSDIPEMRLACDEAAAAGITAVIASDMAVLNYCRSIGLPVHLSVQANAANSEAVRHFAEYADVIVLARELSLEQISEIGRFIHEQDVRGPSGKLVRMEVFAHGALCVAVSGHCYMSLARYGKSANRGECYQPCRREYHLVDDTGEELRLDNGYILSPRDLCTVQYLDRLAEAGVSVLKIEGRARPADYVATVTRVYREALSALAGGQYTDDRKSRWIEELRTVFNRGFWDGGFYCGAPMDKWSSAPESESTLVRTQIGKVDNFFNKPMVVQFTLKHGELREGDELLFEGPSTGAVRRKICGLHADGAPASCAVMNNVVTIQVDCKIRVNDKVFLLRQPSG